MSININFQPLDYTNVPNDIILNKGQMAINTENKGYGNIKIGDGKTSFENLSPLNINIIDLIQSEEIEFCALNPQQLAQTQIINEEAEF